MTTTFQIYASYAFITLICFVCIYHIIVTCKANPKRVISNKEKFYTICTMTNYIPYNEAVLFCSETTNIALTSSHLIAYTRQGSTYTSKIISNCFVTNINYKVARNTAGYDMELTNIVISEKDATMHFLTIPTDELEDFQLAWAHRPVSAMA